MSSSAQEYAFDGNIMVWIVVATLCVELWIAYVAYHMMASEVLKEAKKAEKRLGGPVVGTLHGEIVRGTGLVSAQNQPKRKRDNNYSSRYVVLSVSHAPVTLGVGSLDIMALRYVDLKGCMLPDEDRAAQTQGYRDQTPAPNRAD